MNTLNERPELKVMVLITGPKEAKKAEVVLKDLPLQYLCYGDGTAASEILDILGIGSSRRAVLICVLPKVRIPDVYEVLARDLYIDRHGNGVAFTMPISGVSMLAMEMCNEEIKKQILEKGESEVNQMSNGSSITHGLIAVSINRGFSDDVMTAAKEGGAVGGTVLHARRLGSEDMMKKWGISVQEEKELVLILTKKENKLEIMKSIGDKCGIHSEAHGIVISIPVDSVIGLRDFN